MSVPYGIKLRAKDVIREMFRDPLAPMEPAIERALMNERKRCADFISQHKTIIAGEPADPMIDDILHSMLTDAP